jgi:hypothetical protein
VHLGISPQHLIQQLGRRLATTKADFSTRLPPIPNVRHMRLPIVNHIMLRAKLTQLALLLGAHLIFFKQKLKEKPSFATPGLPMAQSYSENR